MNYLNYLLFPFTLLYWFVTAIRNWLFDIQVLKSTSFEQPLTLCIGNLTVGGTGKTPHTVFFIKKLSEKYEVAMLSRGYGRKTKGFITLNQQHTAKEVGDEPLQIFQHFQYKIPVVVCENRVEGIEGIKRKFPKVQIVILDDAFQHRRLKPTFSILLSTYHRPFYKDFLLPMGRLRESRNGIKRANQVIVTKSPQYLGIKRATSSTVTQSPPHLSSPIQEKIITEINTYSHGKIPITFSSISYGKPYELISQKLFNASNPVLLLSSIANPNQMYSDLKGKYTIVDTLFLPDHQEYTMEIVKKVTLRFQSLLKRLPNISILTTEKDAVKLRQASIAKELSQTPIYVLPITVQLQKDNEIGILLEAINSKINPVSES